MRQKSHLLHRFYYDSFAVFVETILIGWKNTVNRGISRVDVLNVIESICLLFGYMLFLFG